MQVGAERQVAVSGELPCDLLGALVVPRHVVDHDDAPAGAGTERPGQVGLDLLSAVAGDADRLGHHHRVIHRGIPSLVCLGQRPAPSARPSCQPSAAPSCQGRPASPGVGQIGPRAGERLASMTYIAAGDRYGNGHYRRCGRSGLKLPEVSLGLWQNFGDESPIETQRAILRRAFDLGVTHFDLANNYGPPYGSAELNFGRIMREDLRPYRDELIISTKAGYDMWPGPYGD